MNKLNIKNNIKKGVKTISIENDFDWSPIFYFYCIYFAIISIGHIINYYTHNIGAAIFLILLYLKYWRNLFNIRLNFIFFIVLFAILTPIIPIVTYNKKIFLLAQQEIIKYYALHFIILVALSLPLTPINNSKKVWVLYLTILLFLIVGWFWEIAKGVQRSRVQGFLANPNNFALTAIILLLLIPQIKIPYIKVITNFFVAIMIFLSKTGGAFISYVIGLVYNFLFLQKRKLLSIFIIFITALVLVIGIKIIGVKKIEILYSTIKKIEIVSENINNIVKGKSIDYYSIIEKEKKDYTSLLWRTDHWYKILVTFINSPLENIIFGSGIGMSDIKFKSKPHNDYIRMIYETGIIGFILNFLIWLIIFIKMDSTYRWIVIIVAIFCFTDNNYDHFPAISLLIFYMLGAQRMNF